MREFKLENYYRYVRRHENPKSQMGGVFIFISKSKNLYSDSTETNLGYCNRPKSGQNCYSFFIGTKLKQKSFKSVPLMWNNKLLSALVRSLPLFPIASSSLSTLLSFRRRVKHVLSHKSASLSKKQRLGKGERKGAKHLCGSQNTKMKEEHDSHVGENVVMNFKCGDGR